MATIKPSDHAPDEQVHYSFAGVDFDLAPGGSFDTTDRLVLANAEDHPWLDVEVAAETQYAGVFREPFPSAEEDGASFHHGEIAFDPEAIREVEEQKVRDATPAIAIEAGLDQGEPEMVAGHPVTVAAIDEREIVAEQVTSSAPDAEAPAADAADEHAADEAAVDPVHDDAPVVEPEPVVDEEPAPADEHPDNQENVN